MNLLESALAGLEEVRRHLGQTLLSLLGLILGTASIVTVLALFGGQATQTQQFISEVGGVGTVIVSNRDQALNPTARELASKRLTYRDAAFLKERSRTLFAVSPGWGRQLDYRAGDVNFRGQVIGTVPDYMAINDIKPMLGRYLSDLDVRQRARVAVMGWKFADSLYGDPGRAMGRLLNIGGYQFTVVGVLEREEFYFAAWEDNALEYRNERAYVPITTAVALWAANDRLDFLTLKARPELGAAAAQAEVRTLLFARHGVEDVEIRSSSQRATGETSEFFALFNYIFLIVGVVSLFTGGVVIANIFIASVVERVREFGTRMALGATAGGVFAHVLSEVLVVTIAGGLTGLGLGTALTGLVAKVMQLPAVVTPSIALLAIVTAVVVGIIAGVYPALRAARLSPVEALRYG